MCEHMWCPLWVWIMLFFPHKFLHMEIRNSSLCQNFGFWMHLGWNPQRLCQPLKILITAITVSALAFLPSFTPLLIHVCHAFDVLPFIWFFWVWVYLISILVLNRLKNFVYFNQSLWTWIKYKYNLFESFFQQIGKSKHTTLQVNRRTDIPYINCHWRLWTSNEQMYHPQFRGITSFETFEKASSALSTAVTTSKCFSSVFSLTLHGFMENRPMLHTDWHVCS